jgi:hypothetical protein
MDIDKLIERYFKPQSDISELDDFYKVVEETIANNVSPSFSSNPDLLLHEKKKKEASSGRFSFVIPIPKFTPSESWGDPDSQDREDINRLFRVISGGHDIQERINSLNKFLEPTSARRKRSPSLIINMMMIVEALQATLNDYNESAAGFVFEGFMAALTGGKQIAGKVAGTLPIEDFVAFSEFGADLPVSLKLLSPKTPVKGSFTNIVDFLLVRGKPVIKYLVAYKLTGGGGGVQKLKIFDFDVTQDNFINFIDSIGGGWELLYGANKARLKTTLKTYSKNPNKETLYKLAKEMVKADGYSKRGFLHGFLKSNQLPHEIAPSPEEEEGAAATKQARKTQEYERTTLYENETLNTLLFEQMSKSSAISSNAAFHYIEKQTLLEEGSDSTTQWKATFSQLKGLGAIINIKEYGEIDLSQENIEELAEIYTEKLKGGIMTLLEKAKDLTENVGAYYSEKKRSQAQAAASKAQVDAADIQDVLAEDPRYQNK